jgi:hypothetical protein
MKSSLKKRVSSHVIVMLFNKCKVTLPPIINGKYGNLWELNIYEKYKDTNTFEEPCYKVFASLEWVSEIPDGKPKNILDFCRVCKQK